MKIAIVVARVLLGMPLAAFGIIGLLRLVEPQAEQFTPEAMAFLSALDASGYLTQLNSLNEIVCGLLLLSGRFVPLALVLFAPSMVNKDRPRAERNAG